MSKEATFMNTDSVQPEGEEKKLPIVGLRFEYGGLEENSWRLRRYLKKIKVSHKDWMILRRKMLMLHNSQGFHGLMTVVRLGKDPKEGNVVVAKTERFPLAEKHKVLVKYRYDKDYSYQLKIMGSGTAGIVEDIDPEKNGEALVSKGKLYTPIDVIVVATMSPEERMMLGVSDEWFARLRAAEEENEGHGDTPAREKQGDDGGRSGQGVQGPHDSSEDAAPVSSDAK